jgi:hypothetical protein
MRIARIACMLAAVAAIAIASAPVFFDAKLEPPAGRVISGYDDEATLLAYSKAVEPHAPAMISFNLPVDFSSASPFLNHYRAFNAAHGFFVGEVGLSFRGAEHDTSIGMRDPDVIVIADGLRDVGRPVLLRIGYDFNNPAALYEPSAYIGAFRHIADRFRGECPNSATVWNATAAGFSDAHYMKWYPGDDVADWWGVDLTDAHDLGRAETENFIDEATRHRKPILIDAVARNLKSEADALKWYAALFDFIRAHPVVKAVSLGIETRQLRWPRAAAYLKQQLADPRFIDVNEAPSILRPKSTD